jgi:FeS assembly SUF system protein
MNLRKLFRSGKEESPAVPAIDAPTANPVDSRPTEEAATAGAPAVTEEQVVEALHTVYDPEIPVDIYEIGLVYGITIEPPGKVVIQMTLTSPGCPVAGSLPMEVEDKVLAIPGVTSAYVNLVWDPPWGPERMSEAARLQLGFL